MTAISAIFGCNCLQRDSLNLKGVYLSSSFWDKIWLKEKSVGCYAEDFLPF